MKNFSSKMSCAAFVSSVVFLPSCDWLKGKLGLKQSESAASAEVKESE